MTDVLSFFLVLSSAGFIATFGTTAYRAIENDMIRWPFIWAVMFGVAVLALSITLAVTV